MIEIWGSPPKKYSCEGRSGHVLFLVVGGVVVVVVLVAVFLVIKKKTLLQTIYGIRLSVVYCTF